MVWHSHFFKSFPQFVMIHTFKGFSVVNKTEVDVFLKFPCDPAYVGSLISGSSAFSKSSLEIWNFMIHVLLSSCAGGPHSTELTLLPHLCLHLPGQPRLQEAAGHPPGPGQPAPHRPLPAGPVTATPEKPPCRGCVGRWWPSPTLPLRPPRPGGHEPAFCHGGGAPPGQRARRK